MGRVQHRTASTGGVERGGQRCRAAGPRNHACVWAHEGEADPRVGPQPRRHREQEQQACLRVM